MKKGIVSNDVKSRVMGTGRSVFAMTQGRVELDGAELLSDERKEEVKGHFDDTIEHGRETLKTEHSYAQTGSNPSKARGDSQEIGRQLDTAATDLRDVAEIRSRSRKGNVAEAGKLILTTNFPGGSKKFSDLPLEEKVWVGKTMVEVLEGAQAGAVVTAGVTAEVEEFKGLVFTLEEELTREKAPVTTWTQVETMRTILHEKVAMAKVQVIAAYSDLEDPKVVAEREKILAPLREQEARVLELQRRRRGPVDVDPKTGEEVELVKEKEGDGKKDDGKKDEEAPKGDADVVVLKPKVGPKPLDGSKGLT